jgi:hypothetical protein
MVPLNPGSRRYYGSFRDRTARRILLKVSATEKNHFWNNNSAWFSQAPAGGGLLAVCGQENIFLLTSAVSPCLAW